MTLRAQIEPHLRKAGIEATAAACGTSRKHLSGWLAGRVNLSDDRVDALCRALGLRVRVARARSDATMIGM